MQVLRKDNSGRALLLGIIALLVIGLVAAVSIGALFAQRVPDANARTDDFGNPSVGYVDITATIPINWEGSSCTEARCEIFMGPFTPKFIEHETLPSGEVTEPAQLGLTLQLSCSVSVNLEVRGPNGLIVAEQESSRKSVVIGNAISVAWGHVFIFAEGWHEATFTLYAYGGDGCTSYANDPKPVKLFSTEASAGFEFDGVSV